jgi:hypothetical protein
MEQDETRTENKNMKRKPQILSLSILSVVACSAMSLSFIGEIAVTIAQTENAHNELEVK